MKEHYPVSETSLEAEWIQDTRPLMSYYETCSNCESYANSKDYPAQSYSCGKFCPNCGAKMRNPHRHLVIYEYDD